MSTPSIETKAFRDRVVLITGAGQGIGAGLADHFARAGAVVVVNDLVADRAEHVAAEIRGRGYTVTAVVADVTNVAEVHGLFSKLAREHGRLDVLVQSAGYAHRRPITDVDEPYWDQMLGVNLKGPFFCLQSAAQLMSTNGYGRIINITSVGGYAAQLHLSAYGAAKAGLSLLTKAAAVELASQGITVNAVGPGAVEGPWNRQFFDDSEYRKRWQATVPMRRMATNDDVAAAVLFLASEEAGYITGQVLYVDGGKLAYVPSVDILGAALGREPNQSE